MSTMTPVVPSGISGYKPYDTYVALETRQGDRRHYTLTLPLMQVTSVLPVPDPQKPFEDNRIVRFNHAQKFADYIRKNVDWHSGTLTTRTTSGVMTFEPWPMAGGDDDYSTVRIGTLKVPRSARDAVTIVDGQHRILGIDLLFKQLNDDIAKAKAAVAASTPHETPEVLKFLKETVAKHESVLQRVSKDSITIDLIIEDNPSKARQVFVDVADNALGISKAVKGRFDERKVVNRAMNDFLTALPPVLQGHVDLEGDRTTGKSPYLLGAGTLADIIRALTVGIAGRVSAQQEVTLEEAKLVKKSKEFFEDITKGFKIFERIADGSVMVPDVRGSSLLISTTTLRGLAGGYYELRKIMPRSDIVNYFSRLEPALAAPIDSRTTLGKALIDAGTTGIFTEGATAPGARAQQVKELAVLFLGWAHKPPAGI